ncbi:MAG: IgA Peptidase M64 [Prolixibacteraceae bacterium]|nr:IgA Peptidase M64 [Prolixibacteraceae bacterium]
MKHLFLVFALFSLSIILSAQKNVAEFFTEGAVRYDFEFVGRHNSVEVVKKQTKYLPVWGGNYNALTSMPDYGTYRYQLLALESNNLIFQKGFSPLFWEWQTTNEAKQETRSFYQSLFFPRPLSDAFLKLQERTFGGEWNTIFTDTFKIDDVYIINEQYPVPPADTVAYNGASSKHVDLVVLAEGYREDEMKKFSSDVQRLTDSLFAAAPFSDLRDKFNVLALQTPSVESGTDIPGEHQFSNTAFNSHYYTFGSPRYLTVSDMKSVYDVLDGVAWDHIYILVNEERYGGGGFYNFLSVCSSDNVRSPFVFCHEFGHGFAGLADEYYSSATSYNDFYNVEVEPWEPNITTMVQFNKKWFRQIKEGIPVPTQREAQYAGEVGVFEGGGYLEEGIYSPVMSCWMKEESAGEFCPVCQKSIEEAILLHCK